MPTIFDHIRAELADKNIRIVDRSDQDRIMLRPPLDEGDAPLYVCTKQSAKSSDDYQKLVNFMSSEMTRAICGEGGLDAVLETMTNTQNANGHGDTTHPPIHDHSRPFSLHLTEWIRTGPGWWGALFSYCPRIGEGEVDDHSWFFRARGDRWHFCVGTTSGSWAEDEYIYDVDGMFYIHGRWTHPESNAGYMPDDEAWAFIASGLEQWRATYVRELEEMMAGWEGEGGRVAPS